MENKNVRIVIRAVKGLPEEYEVQGLPEGREPLIIGESEYYGFYFIIHCGAGQKDYLLHTGPQYDLKQLKCKVIKCGLYEGSPYYFLVCSDLGIFTFRPLNAYGRHILFEGQPIKMLRPVKKEEYMKTFIKIMKSLQ